MVSHCDDDDSVVVFAWRGWRKRLWRPRRLRRGVASFVHGVKMIRRVQYRVGRAGLGCT